MPLNVRRFCTSTVLILFALIVAAQAQTASPSPSTAAAQPSPQALNTAAAPTSAEVMRDRISKAKAFIAVRNYSAAVYELENIRRETSDASVQGVTNVLLMTTYLEQGDYKRAQDFLATAFNIQKTTKPNASDLYNAVAGQVIKGARMKADRYRALGLMVGDRSMPLEAVNDLEQMRETLELVISQAKEIEKAKTKPEMAMALLEEATTSRSALARDEYDARRWKDEVADSREQLVNSRSVITSAIDGTTSPTADATQSAATAAVDPSASVARPAASTPLIAKTADSRPLNHPPPASNPPALFDPVSDKPAAAEVQKHTESSKPAADRTAKNDAAAPAKIIAKIDPPAAKPNVPVKETPPAAPVKDEGPMEVGSLIAYATKEATPVYPAAARSMRTHGVVTVEVTIDESGDVLEIQNTSGPTLLQTAARDAIRKWKFRPFVRDGLPVKATGFINFNFSL